MSALTLTLVAFLATAQVGDVRDDVPFDHLPVFVRVDRPPSAAAVEALHAEGIQGFVVNEADSRTLDALTGAPLLIEGLLSERHGLWVDVESYVNMARAYAPTHDPSILARADCFRNPGIMERLVGEASDAGHLSRFGPAGLLFASPSLTYEGNPIDFCRCDVCVPDATAADRWTVDEVRARNDGRTGAQVDLSGWLVHADNMEAAFTALVSDLAWRAGHAAGAPAGFAGSSPPNPFTGIDWPRVATSVQLLRPPDDSVTRDLIRSVAPRDAIILSGVRSYGERVRISRQRLWHDVLRRARGVMAHSIDELVDDSGTRQPLLEALSPVLRDLRERVVPVVRNSTFDDSGIGIVFSMTSARIRWLIQTEEDGIHWMSRSHTARREALDYAYQWISWQRVLEDSGYAYRFVPDWMLNERDGSDKALEGLRALVLPDVLALSDRASEAIARFEADGGRVLTSGGVGWFDEHGRGRDESRWGEPIPTISWDLIEERDRDVLDYRLTRYTDDAEAARVRSEVTSQLMEHGIEPIARVTMADGQPARFVQVLRYLSPSATHVAFRRSVDLPEIPNSMFDPSDDVPLDLIATFADGRTLEFTLESDIGVFFEVK